MTAIDALAQGSVIETDFSQILKLDSDGILITRSKSGQWYRCKTEFNTLVTVKFIVLPTEENPQ